MESTGWKQEGNFKEGVFWRHPNWPQVQCVQVKGKMLIDYFPGLPPDQLERIFLQQEDFQSIATRNGNKQWKAALDEKTDKLSE